MNADTSSLESTQIAEFAAGVRAALADLPPEEVEDLTDGLEADLAESLAEDLRRTLPEPSAYAAELRLAAGLPGRVVGAKVGALSGLLEAVRRTRDDLTGAIRRNPALASVLDFAAELRPAWWIVRAWLATWLVAAVFGMNTGYWFEAAWWIVFVAFAVVSVQWGRGRWAFTGLRGLVLVGNVVAVAALLPVLSAAGSHVAEGGYGAGFDEGAASTAGEGLVLAGEPVKNIFAYDAAGNPLSTVQLFDQDGHPLDPFGVAEGDGQPCGDDECNTLVAPTLLETGRSTYGVFPLNVVRAFWDDVAGATVPVAGATATPPAPPFLKVPAVQASAAPTPEPTPSTTVAQPNQ